MDGHIVSLDERRREKNKKLQQASKKDTTRLTELEAELSKVLDLLGDLEQKLTAQDRYLHKLLELLRHKTVQK